MIDGKFFQESRSKDEAIMWLNFDSFSALIESLKEHGFLLEKQIVYLFKLVLNEENISLDGQVFLYLNNLEYIVEEILEGVGDRSLKDITKKNIRAYIKEKEKEA